MNNQKPIVIAVCTGKTKGTIKKQVEQIKLIANYGVEGDAHAGEAIRQVSLLADESASKLRDKIPDLKPGMFAENILTRGIVLYQLPIGIKLRVGQALLIVTQIGKECKDGACSIKQQTGDCCMPREGIFTEVIEGGIVKPGSLITIEE